MRTCESEVSRKVLLAAPRGFCAGVDRAIQTVEVALATYGAPVYVRKQIVHNTHVVADLAARGAIFVDEVDEVPEGSVLVFSAHGVAPAVRTAAVNRELWTRLVDTVRDVDEIEVADPGKVVWLSQTTLTVDEVMHRVHGLRARFPLLRDPPSSDICYASLTGRPPWSG